MARGGMRALSREQGLALLDAALGRDEPLLVPARLDVAARRAAVARGEQPPPLWRALAPRTGPDHGAGRPAAAPPDQAGTLRGQLAALPAANQVKVLTDIIRAQAAVVLGHPTPEAVAAGKVFKDLGFDSLTAVELRNRLTTVTGLHLPATLVFDYPTPLAAAEFVRAGLLGEPDQAPQAPAAGGGRGGRTSRDRRDGLPVPRRRGQPRGPVGPAGRGRRRRLRPPGRPGLGRDGPVRPGPRARGDLLHPPGRVRDRGR